MTSALKSESVGDLQPNSTFSLSCHSKRSEDVGDLDIQRMCRHGTVSVAASVGAMHLNELLLGCTPCTGGR